MGGPRPGESQAHIQWFQRGSGVWATGGSTRALGTAASGHLMAGLEPAGPSGVRQDVLGIPMDSGSLVPRSRRFHAHLRGVSPWKAAVGAAGREVGFRGWPLPQEPVGRQGCLLWAQNWGLGQGTLRGRAGEGTRRLERVKAGCAVGGALGVPGLAPQARS